MKTIIAGSRDIPPKLAEQIVRDAISNCGWEITEVIHGAARGIDSAAHNVCSHLWPTTPYPADWNKHGKAAGAIRNTLMANNADALIAIWDGQSKGTKHMIDTATKLNLKVYVHYT